MTAPVFMGLLPAPNAVLLAAPIVDEAGGENLTKQEKAYITSYLRHIPEAALPLYPGLLLAIGVTGLSAAQFLLAVIPMAILSAVIPYFATVRKVPKETGIKESDNKKRDALELFQSLWPVILLIVIVVAFKVKTSIATLLIVIALSVLYRFKAKELWEMIKKAVNVNMLCSMGFIMVFKDIIS